MKIACLGGGPAGLYFAISMKLRDPSHEITVYERNQPGDTFGWGVVFSDQTMENLRQNDEKSARDILDSFAHWDDIDVHIKGQTTTSTGHGFCGIGRKKLLNILQDRARELDIKLVFEYEVEVDNDLAEFCDADLLIASDGINSKIRNRWPEEFKASVDVRKNKFLWLGTHKIFEAFTFIFEQTEHGWIWAHAYRFDKDTSTFIVECAQETWEKFDFGEMSQDDCSRLCEEIFSAYLDGQELISNAKHLRGSAWLNFSRVECEKWHHKNIVLLGDAAHTAHFSIGSGTKLAFEDAIELAQTLSAGKEYGDIEEALEAYQDTRHLEALKVQSAARNSTNWFENLDRYTDFEPLQFAYSLMTRSQRVSHENLRLRDKAWLEQVEAWLARRATGNADAGPMPPMFTPLKLRDMEIVNRVVVSPMSMYSATGGVINDFHLVHYGARAMGGAGLLFTEMTDVSAEGRITPGCAGLYTDEQAQAWKRVVDYVHSHSAAKFAVQLGHAGPKGSTRVEWEGADQPLDSGNWEIMAPSAVPWSPANQTPRAMTRDDMDTVRADFVSAARRAETCGFDMLELHYAHGYLMSAFITPLTNRRTDEYGGPLENRLRFPLEVFQAVRTVWPAHKPMSVRISATDWRGADGITGEEAVLIGQAFSRAGCDLIDVSAGQTSREAEPVYGRMFQTPFSDQIRNEGHLATMAVGNIYEVDHVNSIIAAGRADLCALGRPHLVDPTWTLRAAAEQHYHDVRCPPQYLSGQAQLERNLERQGQLLTLNV